MWLVIKDFYTDLFSGELSREFDISQGAGQRRILLFMYINNFLTTLSEHCFVISFKGGFPLFAEANRSELASTRGTISCHRMSMTI